ncbi:alpha-amylase/4-alpha-glucanotransferase domain-containing protein [Chrysiogenes arsenatis]|uniref:alpha-amylase/4-alpha-glucanotransferase domain-containing protein n=1 Tax=Chrysiogenes arsenatis TaxID=309797 RepID=UPI000410C7FB|nr:alpha-amylase/4-alpha-glucanotransferase domain-containing protein [Chrysiogenes arsenatis]
MQPSVALLFGIHCHQPYKNFSWVVEGASKQSYAPFLEVAESFPDFRFAVHYSGWLFQWLQQNSPDVFERMQRMARRGQIEFFTGGFYEPVLAAIPHEDRIAQIEMLSEFIRTHFGQRPRGLWLTERVWDASIVPSLVAAGVEYAIVDDYHFFSAGFTPEAMNGYYLTEEGGKSLKLFPISEKLRYTIPFKPESKTIEVLENAADPKRLAAMTFFDDGEKFGVWPNTFPWVYGDRKWLATFFETLLQKPHIIPTHFSDYIVQEPALGLAYLPTCSYQEMGQWSLPPHQGTVFEQFTHEVAATNPERAAFVKGGIWRNFLVKYPESNNIHKKMLRLATLAKGSSAREALFQGQCNDALWHGVFGGLYLPNLRYNVYEALNRCEKLSGKRGIQAGDFDLDGYDEILARTEQYFAAISTRHGGQLFELSSLETMLNYTNTLSRKHEAYHEALKKPATPAEEPTAEATQPTTQSDEIATIHGADAVAEDYSVHLLYDWHLKYSAIDHLMGRMPTVEDFRCADLWEQGDFANQPFQIEQRTLSDVELVRHGGIYHWDKKTADVSIRKKYRFLSGSIVVDITITTPSTTPLECIYGCEWNIHIPSDGALQVGDEIYAKSESFSCEHARSVEMTDPMFHTPLRLSTCTAKHLLSFPVSTVSKSEGGIDLTYQGNSLLFAVPLRLSAEAPAKFSFMLALSGE